MYTSGYSKTNLVRGQLEEDFILSGRIGGIFKVAVKCIGTKRDESTTYLLHLFPDGVLTSRCSFVRQENLLQLRSSDIRLM